MTKTLNPACVRSPRPALRIPGPTPPSPFRRLHRQLVLCAQPFEANHLLHPRPLAPSEPRQTPLLMRSATVEPARHVNDLFGSCRRNPHEQRKQALGAHRGAN